MAIYMMESDNSHKPEPSTRRDVAHDLQLQRDLAIANARTVAELGPLPPGGLPVQVKRKPNLRYRPLPAPTSYETQENEAMKLNQAVTVAALTAGMVACEPSSKTDVAEQPPMAAPAITQAPSIVLDTGAAPKATVPEHTSPTPAVPDEIQAFVPPDSTLLAYKRFDLTGDGSDDAVLIVRHPVTETYADFSKNPCDLIVLHGEAGRFKVAAKSSKVVDCTYKLYARETASRPNDLNGWLELKPQEIVADEETDKPMGVSTTYSFKYSSKEKDWHLSYARAAFARSKFNGEEGEELDDEKWELVVYTQVVRYPKDIPFISLSKFDPDDDLLLRVMVRNQEEI